MHRMRCALPWLRGLDFCPGASGLRPGQVYSFAMISCRLLSLAHDVCDLRLLRRTTATDHGLTSLRTTSGSLRRQPRHVCMCLDGGFACAWLELALRQRILKALSSAAIGIHPGNTAMDLMFALCLTSWPAAAAAAIVSTADVSFIFRISRQTTIAAQLTRPCCTEFPECIPLHHRTNSIIATRHYLNAAYVIPALLQILRFSAVFGLLPSDQN